MCPGPVHSTARLHWGTWRQLVTDSLIGPDLRDTRRPGRFKHTTGTVCTPAPLLVNPLRVRARVCVCVCVRACLAVPPHRVRPCSPRRCPSRKKRRSLRFLHRGAPPGSFAVHGSRGNFRRTETERSRRLGNTSMSSRQTPLLVPLERDSEGRVRHARLARYRSWLLAG